MLVLSGNVYRYVNIEMLAVSGTAVHVCQQIDVGFMW